MHVVITKIDEVLFRGEAKALHLAGAEGEMTILPHHSPLVTTLKKGNVTVTTTDGQQTFPVTDGFLEVGDNAATVLI